MFVAVRRPLAALTVSGVVSRATVTMADALAKLPDVEIDPEGTFKYILLRVNVTDGDANKDIVRGTKSAEYHSKWTGMEGARSASFLRVGETCKPVSGARFKSCFWANVSTCHECILCNLIVANALVADDMSNCFI